MPFSNVHSLCLLKYCSSVDDTRFIENEKCLEWLRKWKQDMSSLENANLSAKERNKRFIAAETKFDVFSMVIGVKEFCKHMFDDFPGCSINASKTNQDPLGNLFGQERSLNGQNDNPTVYQYGKN